MLLVQNMWNASGLPTGGPPYLLFSAAGHPTSEALPQTDEAC
jgi:hypothetical protein